jgi:hypothetical protein
MTLDTFPCETRQVTICTGDYIRNDDTLKGDGDAVKIPSADFEKLGKK